MNWKNWPYWLKGGIIGSLTYLIIIVPSLYFTINDIGIFDNIGFNFYLILSLPSAVIPFFGNCSFNYGFNPSKYSYCDIFGFVTGSLPVVALFFSFITYFIIGGIIGYIYGKIKNRKQIINNQ
jgi:hypothetical protein